MVLRSGVGIFQVLRDHAIIHPIVPLLQLMLTLFLSSVIYLLLFS